jgi:ethanolamine utilization protein EutQ (cupin superfamily)
MPTLIFAPSQVPALGTPPKRIEEFVGRVTSGTESVSVARMKSLEGWTEPGQRPAFDEYTVVLQGRLRVEHEGGTLEVRAGQALIVQKGEWVRYSTPYAEGAEYIAVCVPAFSSETAHRDE